jgi:hypothetical protein
MKLFCLLFSICLAGGSWSGVAFAASPPVHCLNCEVVDGDRGWSVSVFSRDPLSEEPHVSLMVEKYLPDGRTQHLVFEAVTIAEFQWEKFFGTTFFISGVRIRSLMEEPGIFEIHYLGPVTFDGTERRYNYRGRLTAYYPGFEVNEVEVSCDYYLLKNI